MFNASTSEILIEETVGRIGDVLGVGLATVLTIVGLVVGLSFLLAFIGEHLGWRPKW